MVDAISELARDSKQWCVLLSEGDSGILGWLGGVDRILLLRGRDAWAVSGGGSDDLRGRVVGECHDSEIFVA